MSSSSSLFAGMRDPDVVVDESVEACVVGGGVAGLRVAEMLRERGVDALVVEAGARAGGRVKTVREGGKEEGGAILYEGGPWRLPSSHARAADAFRRHGLRLRSLPTPPAEKKAAAHTKGAEPRPGLSTFDTLLLHTEKPHEADRADQETGYAGTTASESTAVPYAVGEKEPLLLPVDGFDSLVAAMAAEAQKARRLLVGCRVVDVRREGEQGYLLPLSVRRGKSAFAAGRVRARHVFVCVPPRAAMGWPSFAPLAQSHLHRVEEGCLHHVYVEGRLLGRPRHVVDARTPLVQTLSTEYDNGWMQASYTAGRMARFWHRLRMVDPRRFRSLLLSLLSRHFSCFRAGAQGGDGGGAVHSHFKEGAYHAWRPAFRFDLRSAVLASVTPCPASFPRLYWAGEAYSSHQAWIEGALETAELAVAAWEAGGQPLVHPVRPPRPDEAVVEGRVLGGLREWAASHPGGERAILSHVGEDLTAYLHHIGHSAHAWAVVACLQVAWVG